MDASILFDWLVGLITLTSLELVLGIDNIVMISILVEKLPQHRQDRARVIGLGLALLMRIMFLLCAVWLTKLNQTVLTVFQFDISIRDLVLIFGGLFLIAKATTEIFNVVEMNENHDKPQKQAKLFALVIGQIVLLDIVFSLDSVLTAIGLSDHLSVIILAVVISMGLMLVFASAIADFVKHNPGIKLLALSFLVMIGVLLLAEGLDSHFNRGYVYFAMAFSLLIELLNRRRKSRLHLSKKNV